MAEKLGLIERSIWRDCRLDVDPGALPVTIVIRAGRLHAATLIVFGGFIGSPLFLGPPQSGLALLVFVGMLATGLMIAGYGIGLLFIRRKVTLHPDRVSVEERGLRGIERWSLPYRQFQGVLRKERWIWTHRYTLANYRPILFVELYHKDPKRRVPIFAQGARNAKRARWEEYARAFNLPGIEGSGDKLEVRAIEDLDKSLRDLVSEGKISYTCDPRVKPSEITIGRPRNKGEGLLRLTYRRSAAKQSLFMLIFAVGAVVLYPFFPASGLGEQHPTAHDAFVFVAFLIIILPFVAWLFAERLDIGREAVERSFIFVPTGHVVNALKRLQTNDVESVSVMPGFRNFHHLVIASDTESTSFGFGLSADGLQWVRGVVIEAIAGR